MIKSQLLEALNNVEKIAKFSKIERLLVNPFKYIFAILYKNLVYGFTKNDYAVKSSTFFGKDMYLLLPSSTDIYLTKGKSHDSEIRLARYLIQTLTSKDVFFDIGAHYGYFSMLGSLLVGNEGRVFSFEAAPKTYAIFEKNAKSIENIKTHNLAVSDTPCDLTFYEFPNLYAEFNSLDLEQFKKEKWFANNQPKSVTIPGVVLDELLRDAKVVPNMIKIDVEGAEFRVIKGMEATLRKHSPILIMEYLSLERGNDPHQEASKYLHQLGYLSYMINPNGTLSFIQSIDEHLEDSCLESDNIVFVKS